jgi:hypothetical protein
MPADIQRKSIQQAIADKLLSISGVENVYTEYVRATDLETFRERYEQADQELIQYWKITRRSSDPHTAESHPGTVNLRTGAHYYHTFDVELFIGYRDDLSESVCQDLIDTVLNEFADERTLGAWNSARPLALISVDQQYQNGILGHLALFDITLIDYQNGLAPH